MYIQVILPLRISWEPYYSAADGAVSPGDRVKVRFAGKEYTAVVCATDVTPDIDASKIQPVTGPAPGLAPVTAGEIRLWRFVAEHYLCTVGEVFHAAYPEGKNRSEEIVTRREENAAAARQKELDRLAAKIERLAERLVRKETDLDRPHGDAVRQRLQEERKKIRTEMQDLADRKDALERGEPEADEEGPAWRRRATVFDRLPDGRPAVLPSLHSSAAAVRACAEDTLAAGRDVLVLVPEVKYLAGTVRRLGSRLAPYALTYHGTADAAGKRAALPRLRDPHTPTLVVGTRSAVFLPWSKLGLVVVTEEQEDSYKQDSAPRYNGRDTAGMLAHMQGARTLLTTSCPSLETLYNLRNGKYAAADDGTEEEKKEERQSARRAAEFIDTAAEAKKNGLAGMLSFRLVTEVRKAVRDGGKALLLNPWGESPVLEAQAAEMLGQEMNAGSVEVSSLPEALARDLSGYALVALLDAGRISHPDDYRGDEKTARKVQALIQACPGRIIIQAAARNRCFFPDAALMASLLEERKDFDLPPYTRQTDVILRDGSEKRLAFLSDMLRKELGTFRCAGPFPGRNPFGKPDGTMRLRITTPKSREGAETKKRLKAAVDAFCRKYRYAEHVHLDADPI